MSMTNQHGSKAPVVEIQKLNPKAVMPTYQTPGAAGFDLASVQDVKLEPGERAVVKTGLAFAIPEGWEMQVRPRSGLAAKNGITVVNAPGTIDSDYRGEVMVILLNTGNKDFYVMAGDRIAQGVIAYAPQAALVQVQELGETARGADGLGSTGV